LITIFAPLFEWVQGADHPNPDTLRSRNNRAMSYLAAGRPAKAIPLYRRTLADCERVLGVYHPYTLRSRNNLAMSYRAAGRPAEAIPLLERTLADCERVLGADHPDTRAAREDLAALTGESKRLRHV
jgi:tetratricopeptide (TPR) repeat protein